MTPRIKGHGMQLKQFLEEFMILNNYIRKGESLKVNDLDFLVVQWPGLSIRPMQGTQVPPLVRELDPTCCN